MMVLLHMPAYFRKSDVPIYKKEPFHGYRNSKVV